MLIENTSTKRFIRESLPLLSSYFYSEQVQLEPSIVEAGQELSEEYERFAHVLRLRHAIACAMELQPIVAAIEKGVSSENVVLRSESKGKIVGRLDVSLFINRRNNNFSWPRTFPILVTKAIPNTPENQLVSEKLREIVKSLEVGTMVDKSTERSYVVRLLQWGRSKLHSEPWTRAIPSRRGDRLRRETEYRIRKRQTGNEAAYRKFLSWCDQWQYDPVHADSIQNDILANLLLAFPSDDFFADRVFEIWCLWQLIESFRRCGAVTISGPRSLSKQSSDPVCEMDYRGFSFDIWFQRSL